MDPIWFHLFELQIHTSHSSGSSAGRSLRVFIKNGNQVQVDSKDVLTQAESCDSRPSGNGVWMIAVETILDQMEVESREGGSNEILGPEYDQVVSELVIVPSMTRYDKKPNHFLHVNIFSSALRVNLTAPLYALYCDPGVASHNLGLSIKGFFHRFSLNSRRSKLKVFTKLKNFSLNSRIFQM